MGWKNVKEHYRIGHHVRVEESGICIGSSYVHDLLVIALDGRSIVKRYTNRSANEDLWRYQQEMDADMGKLQELVENADTFERSVPVFTYKGGEILEKQCETPGWPNVTHDGQMMYENTFSTDKATVVNWAKQNAELGIEFVTERLAEKKAAVWECERCLEKNKADLLKLETDYPTPPEAKDL